MATSASTLIQQTRRFIRDWRDWDTTTTAMTAGQVSMTVSDTSIYAKRWTLEVDQEMVLITASPQNSTTLLIRRGLYGSTAASHATSSSVLMRPNFFSIEILDALNEAIQACFPLIYKPVAASLTGSDTTYGYTIPDMPGYTGYPIPFIYKIDVLQSGDLTFRDTRRFEIVRGAAQGGLTTLPAIKFRSPPASASTVRLRGFGPFPKLTGVTDTLDPLWPPQAEYLLPIYAAATLLMSGEAARVRFSAGAIDEREQANRVGSSSAIGNMLWQRFRSELALAAMPALPRHCESLL
jgi:hypothetical protein